MDGILRDVELRIKGHLYEIRQVNDEVLEHRQGLHPALTGYQETLESVAQCATITEVDEIAEKIKTTIRDYERRPANQQLRRVGRKKVSRAGYPADDYLNAA